MTTTTTGRYCRLRAFLLSVGLLVLWSAHALGAGGTLTIIPHADLKNTDPIWTNAYITRVSKDELLSQSDIVTIHLVLSARTRGLIGTRELGLMQRTAYLINTSRGPIIEEPALIQALQQGTITGAGLDLFDEEPVPLNHPFRRLENTVITPHLGYVTLETYRIFLVTPWRTFVPS
jgi:phosphoglycerate dehydrogenase-like enzyme